MSGYTKLFSSIVNSTIWRAADHIRLVWITMLALADRNGIVEASVPGLADAARVSLDECMAALEHLASPDPWSRTAANAGRRIEAVDGGWVILNHGVYRDRLAKDVARQQTAERVARFRARRKAEESAAGGNGSGNAAVTHGNENNDKQHQLQIQRREDTVPALVRLYEGDEAHKRVESTQPSQEPETGERR